MNFRESWEREPLGKSRRPVRRAICHPTDPPLSEVHRARSRKTGTLVALKKIIMHHEKDGVCNRKA